MYPDDPQKNPMSDPKNRPTQVLLMAIGIAVVMTLLGGFILYLSEIWKAQPLG